jgi:lycopene beta-cyclase
MKKYDYIIAGAGCAGLSLAYRMSVHPELKKLSVLILDKDDKQANDRTWCFWTDSPSLFDPIVFRKWNKVRFKGDDVDRTDQLSTYSYHLIRGADFYQYTKQEILSNPNFQWEQKQISILNQDESGPYVIADGEEYRAEHIFNSCFHLTDFAPGPDDHFLLQHFKGWEIETEEEVFDSKTITLMDFQTPQKGNARFYYVLPFSKNRALVEYTLFSEQLLEEGEYHSALEDYIKNQLGISKFSIRAHEAGVIPMTDAALPKPAGKNITHIGTLGGAVKPTTGYAFLRIQEQTAGIVEDLEAGLLPKSHLPSKARYQFYDKLLLYILSHHGHLGRSIFSRLFKNNRIELVFTFLNEKANLWQEARIFAFLPKKPFLYAVWVTQFFNKMKKVLLPKPTNVIKKIS